MTKTIKQLLTEAGVPDYQPQANRVQITRRPLYCRRNINGTQADKATVDFFHKGVGDDMAYFGGTAGTAANRLQTNLQPEGRLAEGELFICLGVAFQLPHDISITHANLLHETTVSWVENAETVRKQLGQFEDFPAQVRLDYIIEDQVSSNVTTATQRLVRSVGRAGMGDSPLFYIRGGVSKHDAGKLQLEFHQSSAFGTTGPVVKAKLYGLFFQKLGA